MIRAGRVLGGSRCSASRDAGSSARCSACPRPRGLPAAAVAPARAAPERTVLLDLAIAGGAHHGLYAVRDALALGEALRLRREPENPHDELAIAIERADGTKLGYVPRAANAALARLLDAGKALECEVVGRFDFGRSREELARDLAGVASTSILGGDPRLRVTLVAYRRDAILRLAGRDGGAPSQPFVNPVLCLTGR